MKRRKLLAFLVVFLGCIYIFGARLLDSAITSIFYNNESKYVALDATLQIRSSDHDYFTFYEIYDNRCGLRWIPFCYSSGSRDKFIHIVLNGHSAIVSSAKPNAILYYYLSRDKAYPFSIFDIPGVSAPILPPGYVYEYDVRNPEGVATLCGPSGVGIVSRPLKVVLRELYAGRYQLGAEADGYRPPVGDEPSTPTP